MNGVEKLLTVLAVCLTLAIHLSSSVPRRGRNVSFHAGTHFRNEFRGEDGSVEGEYGFRTPDGCMHVVRFKTTNKQYRVLGTVKRDCKKPSRRNFPKKTNKPTQRPRPVERDSPITTRSVFTTRATTRQSTTTTTRQPTTTTARRPTITTTPIITTKRPVTTTRRPATTTHRRQETTSRPVTTVRGRPLVTPEEPISTNEIRGKQLFDTADPPPDMKRPRILEPDDPDPVYSFGFEAPGHGHTQAGLPDGTKKGEYFFDSPDGWRRFVTYVATKDGFFPKLRNERIPDWENSPLNPKNHLRDAVKRQEKKNGNGVAEGDGEGKQQGKQLVSEPEVVLAPSNGCPYYFYTNTKINFHWERCILNGTRVGSYGRLADDGYQHRVDYFADERGFRPKVYKIPLTRDQEEAVAGFTQGAFIIPKIDEEKQETERRIQEWISQNQERIDSPL